MRDNVGAGGNDCDLLAEQKLYDALPTPVRLALANAPYKFGPMTLFRDKVYWASAASVAREIEQVSKQQVPQEAKRLYGPKHPQACR